MRPLFYLATALVGLTLGILPLDVGPQRRGGALVSPAGELRREVTLTLQDATEARLADSVAALMAGVPARTTFLVHTSPGVELVARSAVDSAAREYLDGLAFRPAGVRVGILVLDPREVQQAVRTDLLASTAASPPRLAPASRVILAGTDARGPWCVRLETPRSLPSGRIALPSPAEGNARVLSDLSTCAWVARYGLPGPHVARWLDRSYHGAAGPAGDWPETRWSWVGEPATRACRAGELEVCQALFEDRVAVHFGDDRAVLEGAARPGWAGPQLALWSGRVASRAADPYLGGILLELRREFGDAAVQGFWTSDRPLARAFADAFGTPAGRWYHQRLTAALGPTRAGPWPRPGHLVSLLLAAAVGLGFARRVVSRRTVA